MTRQRREVYDVLMDVRDHPTAAEVFDRTKQRMPHISLATVYNCLETLTEAGLVKQVNTDRGSARYCPNLREHAHFVCGECGGVFDVDPEKPERVSEGWNLPEGSDVTRVEVVIKGTCPVCNSDEA